MKTLIYAMQSSGASLFAYWLSQQNDCIGVIDLYYDQIAPEIDHANVVLKCVANKCFSLEDHKKAFKPDKIILFTRNPIFNYLSLTEKTYANWGGTIEEKFRIFDQNIENFQFDLTISYEDFIMKKDIGIGESSYFDFKKKINDIIQYNNVHNSWCQTNYKKKWGIGNIHANNLNATNINWCPNLYKMYGG